MPQEVRLRMPEEVRNAIIKESLKTFPLAYFSLIDLLEGLNEYQVIILQFLESHNGAFCPRSELHKQLKCTTVQQRRKVSNQLRSLQRRGYIEIQVNHYAKDRIIQEGSKCLARVLHNIETFLIMLSTEILNSIEDEQDKEHLIGLSTKFIKKIQRDPNFLSSAIIRARDKIDKQRETLTYP